MYIEEKRTIHKKGVRDIWEHSEKNKINIIGVLKGGKEDID